MAVHQEELSFRPSDILQSFSGQVCERLSVADESLLLFSGKLFEKNIIDKATKNNVRRTKGYEGADILIDHVMEKLEDNPLLFEDVIKLMKEVDLLLPIALEIEKKTESGIQPQGGGANGGGKGVVDTDGPSLPRVRTAPSQVLRKHMTKLLDLISNPDKLATDCCNKKLISKSTQDDVLTTNGISRYSKASKIVHDFQRQLEVYDEQHLLKSFCDVLREQGNPQLERKAKEILYDL